MTEPDEPRTTRWPLDTSGERASAWLRLTAAVVVGIAAIWLAASGPGTVGWVVAVTGLLAALGFGRAAAKGLRRARRPDAHYLEVDPRGLTLADGGAVHHIAWTEVADVDVDEEKLVVRVTRKSGEPLAIEPRYAGVSLEALGAALRASFTARARAEHD